MTPDLFKPKTASATYGWNPIPWFLVAAFAVCAETQAKEASPVVTSRKDEVPRLAFADFLEASSPEPRLSRRLLELSGQRVKLVGFMAKMEVAPKGAFYLTPRPVSCDEEGGGTADLPPEAVYVMVRSSAGEEIPHTPRALEVTGLLDVGYRVEQDERVTHIRLLLDRPQDLPSSVLEQ
jgi:hypothetical protein